MFPESPLKPIPGAAVCRCPMAALLAWWRWRMRWDNSRRGWGATGFGGERKIEKFRGSSYEPCRARGRAGRLTIVGLLVSYFS